MGFKLNIQTTEKVTTDDLEIFVGDLPLIFEAIGNITGDLQSDLLAWSQADYSVNQAIQLVPRLFKSVSQNGDTYPLTGQAEAEALHQAVGDDLLKELVEGYWNYRYRFFKRKRRASASSSTEPPAMEASEVTL